MLSSTIRRSGRNVANRESFLRVFGAACYSTSPATVTSKKSDWSFLTGIFGRAPPPLPPLSIPLDGVKLPDPSSESSVIETKLSKLDNGVTISSENTPGNAISVGIYINSGSIYETSRTQGTSHLLERLAFKSTVNRSHFRFIREMEAIGGSFAASASRETTIYVGDAAKPYLPEVVELLADTVRNPVFLDWEVKAQLENLQADIAQLNSNPESLLIEGLHAASFAGALGQPLHASPASLASLTPESLHNFVQENFTAPRIVISAAGVDHDELKAIAGPLFEDLPVVKPVEVPRSQYIGGEWRLGTGDEYTHVVIGFELPGGWSNVEDSAASIVIQTLMGGGGAFSAGGPGKGMHSKLFRNVLGQSKDGAVETCNFISSVYDNTGLLGVYVKAKSEHVGSAVDLLTRELLTLAIPGAVSSEELNRAKNAAISSIYFALENRGVVAEDIGRQVLAYGQRKSTAEFIDLVRSLTAGDITRLARKILQTPLSLGVIGHVENVPRVDQLAARFH